MLEPLTLPAHHRDELVDERGLERHVRHHLLDGGALGFHGTQGALTGGGRASLVVKALVETGDLALVTPHAREGQKHRPDGLRLELAALGQNDDVISGNLLATQTIAHVEERTDGHRDTGEGAAKRDLPDLDASADLHLLACGQERHLADLFQVQPDRILALARERRDGLGGV